VTAVVAAALIVLSFTPRASVQSGAGPTPIPGLINDDYDFQIVQQADRG
jgi:hypothetical protein